MSGTEVLLYMQNSNQTQPEVGHAVLCIEYAYCFLQPPKTYAVLAHHIAAVDGGSSRYFRYRVQPRPTDQVLSNVDKPLYENTSVLPMMNHYDTYFDSVPYAALEQHLGGAVTRKHYLSFVYFTGCLRQHIPRYPV